MVKIIIVISRINIKVMKSRMNQLVIQVLLMVIITVIVAYTCVSLAELVGEFSEAAFNVLSRMNSHY